MKQQRPLLRVIAGDFDAPLSINGVSIRLSALERKLPAVQALVVEQDTGMLLDEALPGLDMEHHAPRPDLILEEDFDYPLGTILPKRGQPLHLHMVIHDLHHSPNWSEASVELALQHLFDLLPTMGIGSLAMPALAHRHGALPVAQFITLLCDYLAHHPLPWNGDLWLLLPRETLQASLAALHTQCDIHQP